MSDSARRRMERASKSREQRDEELDELWDDYEERARRAAYDREHGQRLADRRAKLWRVGLAAAGVFGLGTWAQFGAALRDLLRALLAP